MDSRPPSPAPVGKSAGITIALVGNPNTGKSTLFSALCGVPARIGNYPGVTVEKKIGRYRDESGAVTVVDLPGTYSLAARTLDEKVSVDVLLGRQADVPSLEVIVVVVDVTNLERNLYLFTQLRQLGKPTLLVLNMWDRATATGIKVDLQALSERLGTRVVTASASRKQGIGGVKQAIRELSALAAAEKQSIFSAEVQAETAAIQQWTEQQAGVVLAPFLAERLLFDRDGAHAQELQRKPGLTDLSNQLQASRQRLADAGQKIPALETATRYSWIRSQLDGVVHRPAETHGSTSDSIDRVMTHRVWGLIIFAAIMFVVFQAITWGTGWAMDRINDDVMPAIAGVVESVLPPGTLRSLLNDGIVAGVGSVLVFLPQILMLFFFIGLLEDCGYMARAAFVMDKLMTKLGLSGKSFLPLMSSFACAVPGIMATRVIENRRDRMVTILVAPLMSCSARLPVYILLIYAFVPQITWLGGWIGLQGLVLFLMHIVGLVVAVPVAWLLKRFFFPGDVPPFVMELPSYKMPSPGVVFFRVWERAEAFITRAGTLIFCTSILVWAAGYFPGDHTRQHEIDQRLEAMSEPASEAEVAEYASLLEEQRSLSGRLIEGSALGIAGKAIEPVVRPLGWDWKIGVGVIASFPAREVIIATLGTIYSLGGDSEEASLQSAIRESKWPDGRPVFTISVALSIMVFFALCAQCAATLMVIKRETNSWRWPAFTFAYMTLLAYVGALLTYQVGSRLIG
ncbi:ferrous iron transport protein B [Aureliella helgolandensis]|uniref:Ferrous iron transport protein B n=1 Tax=Aureliella helgolandensis TaxID=2527968 RepID=A0A518GFD2_9BACT|nr:ferrous iron transport protein B [Aureliella helgolandensis]QDV27277.1 Ferrous iron transport protein B [Aureliella helgolandensis]